MNNFDARWREMARLARQAPPTEEVPRGFAARAVARSFAPRPAPADVTWDRLIGRFLVGVTTALLLCAAIEWRHLRNTRPLEPGIENAVAQLVWML